MVLPRLIHPVSVVVEQIDEAKTIYDPRTRSVIGDPARTTVTVRAQLSNKRHDQLAMNPGGREEEAEGYILVRVRDLENAGITLKIGDKITKMGRRSVVYYITREQYLGGYPDQDGHSLIRYYYRDRSPVK